MRILNTELPDLNIADVEVLEKYENAVQAVADKINSNQKYDKGSQRIRALCTAVFEAFDELFGDGTANKIFGDKTNMTDCAEAYSQLINEVKRIDRRNANIVRSKFSFVDEKPAFKKRNGKNRNKGYRR